MLSDTPEITTKHSISSAGDLHDATPVLASTLGRQRRASSDGTAADSSEEGGAGRQNRPGEKQVVRDEVAPAPPGPPAGGPPFKKFGHKCESQALCMWEGPCDRADTMNDTMQSTIRHFSSSTSLGSAVVTAGINNRNGNSLNGSSIGRLGFFEGDVADYPDEASVIHAVVENELWGVVVVNADATVQLQAARQSGNSMYDPRSAIGFYYAQARMENAINGYLVPITSSLLTQTTERWASQSIAEYYFTFVFAMAFNVVREIIGPKLTLRSYLAFRLIVPVVVYAWLALNLAMINLPFKLPFDAKFTYAGGFFLWWMVLYAGMLAVGFALEFCIVLLTPRFVAFALLPIIIVQVSVVSLPHELQPRLYRYGVATPFYRVSNAVRTIIFNTKNDIGVDFGILLGWTVLSMITVSALTTLFRRKEEKKEQAEREKAAVGNA
ncbi:hypothetical protein QFC24_006079 [Naganishia onofrii]|uniref:Uncharacterized protein n=1 Tax=Naganishia onofrii TaxID=1851511 RepID=A0ACC2X5K9_9TREE|nr:hypothetical protein QFC24_006079 [Naganishia onofrii]